MAAGRMPPCVKSYGNFEVRGKGPIKNPMRPPSILTSGALETGLAIRHIVDGAICIENYALDTSTFARASILAYVELRELAFPHSQYEISPRFQRCANIAREYNPMTPCDLQTHVRYK